MLSSSPDEKKAEKISLSFSFLQLCSSKSYRVNFIPRFHSRTHPHCSRWPPSRRMAPGGRSLGGGTLRLHHRRTRRPRSHPRPAERELGVGGYGAGGIESGAADVGLPESEQGKRRKMRSVGGSGRRSRRVGEWHRPCR